MERLGRGGCCWDGARALRSGSPASEAAMSADMPESDASQEMALALRLREAREYLGLLQEDVAAALGIPRETVSAFESGDRRVSSLELRRLGRLYRRPVAWLLNEEGAALEADAPPRRATKPLSGHDKEQVLRSAEFLAGPGRPGLARADGTQSPVASEQNQPQRPLRNGKISDRGAELRSVGQMLTTQQRKDLRADLAEIARCRRQAEDASNSFWLR